MTKNTFKVTSFEILFSYFFRASDNKIIESIQNILLFSEDMLLICLRKQAMF